MQVDVYHRAEPGQKFSYLLVPHGQVIPEEVTNVDWELRQQDVNVDATAAHVTPYEIDEPGCQIQEKGYAIASLANQVPAAAVRREDNPS